MTLNVTAILSLIVSLPFFPLSLHFYLMFGSLFASWCLSFVCLGSLVDLLFFIFFIASFSCFVEYFKLPLYSFAAYSARSLKNFLISVTFLPYSCNFGSSSLKFSVLMPKFNLMKSFARKKGCHPSSSASKRVLGRFYVSNKSIFNGCLC